MDCSSFFCLESESLSGFLPHVQPPDPVFLPLQAVSDLWNTDPASGFPHYFSFFPDGHSEILRGKDLHLPPSQWECPQRLSAYWRTALSVIWMQHSLSLWSWQSEYVLFQWHLHGIWLPPSLHSQELLLLSVNNHLILLLLFPLPERSILWSDLQFYLTLHHSHSEFLPLLLNFPSIAQSVSARFRYNYDVMILTFCRRYQSLFWLLQCMVIACCLLMLFIRWLQTLLNLSQIVQNQQNFRKHASATCHSQRYCSFFAVLRKFI